MTERYALGIDVGGTFTDLALIRLSDGRSFYHKTSSTPDDPSLAMGAGIEALLAAAEADARAVSYFGHGTTVATNALIEGRTARTGLVTTEGFGDVLEIRRQRQPHNYNIRVPKPTPPVPRHLRREMAERTFLFGHANRAPRRDELTAIVEDFRAAGVEAVAVAFLHSYHNPAHEAAVLDWLRETLPEAFVCASHEILAEFREYERISTTVLNASLGPVMHRYLSRLEARSRDFGLGSLPHILQSNGGIASPREAGKRPVRTLASGPAAGVTGAIHLAREAGFADIITFDVGGTSTDVCLIDGGEPLLAHEREFAGYPVRFPMLDVHSVGAGGGSIASVDTGGFFHVGPRSAGANPGPVCYNGGGEEPTVTDANVVLGHLHPETLLGGRMPIRKDLAWRAIERRVARPLGIGVEEAAEAILTILNENLVRAIRVITVEQGFDPRRFALVSFGGAGPLLSSALARELGISRILVPEGPGLLCALGLLVADIRSDFSLTRIIPLDEAAPPLLGAAFAEVTARAQAWFEEEHVAPADRVLARAVDMRYLGQSHELTVPALDSGFDAESQAALIVAFRREHERVYGYAPDAPVQVVNLRISAKTRVSRPPLAAHTAPPGCDPGPALIELRKTYFQAAGGSVDCPVYDRAALPRQAVLEGPAIVEQMDTTTLLLPGQRLRRDAHGNLILELDVGGKD